LHDYWFGRFRFAFFFAISALQLDRVGLRIPSSVFFMFFIIALEYPRLGTERSEQFSETIHQEDQGLVPALHPV
jgi:hypothetical protein